MSTYTPIATQTLGSAAASVTFSSIPQGYTDLVLVSSILGSDGTNDSNASIRFNSDSGSNYSRTTLSGDGSTAASFRTSNATRGLLQASGYYSSTIPTVIITNINNYSNSTTNKTVISRANLSTWSTEATVNLWRNTSAITSLTLVLATGTFASGTTFSLYGIQVGNAAQKAQGGNIVTSDGTYVYHTFTSSGSFITNEALTVDYLVVAGGGSGGYAGGAGGGAGGLRCTVGATGGGGSLESALSLSSGKSYPVIIGAGGAGLTTNGAGNNGSDSVFHTITSTGGGGGGNNANNGKTGGSGGGRGDGFGSAGSGTTNQGYAGGGGNNGGGGGAGEAGNTDGTGHGGDGVATSISGTSTTYAGGGVGNGGTPGTGGGGAASTAGTVNTGGGGGWFDGTGSGSGAGGSGIVIIRYAI
jgi:hypothetical protein